MKYEQIKQFKIEFNIGEQILCHFIKTKKYLKNSNTNTFYDA